jgi:hypothetical protein
MSSNQLGSGVSVLNGNLGGSFDILSGSAGENPRLGIGRRYGGAVAAFSLRDIGAEGGRVIRVRRDTGGGAGDDDEEDFSANQITSGALEAFVGSGNTGTVVRWYDQSGNGKDFIATADNFEPTIVSSGTLVTDNGKPAIEFGDIEHFDTDTSVQIVSQAQFFVLNATDQGTGANDLMGTKSGGLYQMRLRSDANDDYQYRVNGESAFFGSVSEGNQIILSVDRDDSNNTKLFQDGSQTGDTKVGGITDDMITERLGKRATSPEEFVGKMQEVIFFDGDKSSDRTSITNELNAYYGAF